MNNKKKHAPRCPYCGAEMRDENSVGFIDNPRYWYRCTNKACGITSPDKSTRWNAYRTAMTRYEEPNRVLTLDEVFVIACNDYNTEQETAMYLECREDNEGYAIVTDVETDGSKILLEFSGIGGGCKLNEKDYGRLWRCWRRKPTEKERENTPWEDEDER